VYCAQVDPVVSDLHFLNFVVYIFRKMSANVVFNNALGKVRENSEVAGRLGTPIKGYGRDHGGKRVGRRNFIEHTEYKSEEDGSGRTRVRFNLEGPHGQAFVFAEVSNQMASGEFVYCEYKSTLLF
jgi:import inner membrane translocase subunit TIM21